MQLSLVIFDLDGTLLDTSEGVMCAIDSITEAFNLRSLSTVEKQSFIGPPIQVSFERQYSLTKERAWEIATRWREVYKDEYLFYAKPYDGIYELLTFCREMGLKTAVATNKREDYTRTLLEHFGFTEHFDCICGTDMAGTLTKPELILRCIDRTGAAEPERCLMVGDTEGDLAAAKAAGTDFLGVTYGYGFREGEVPPGVKLAASCDEAVRYLKPLV